MLVGTNKHENDHHKKQETLAQQMTTYTFPHKQTKISNQELSKMSYHLFKNIDLKRCL